MPLTSLDGGGRKTKTMAINIEDHLPVVKYNGLNTAKDIVTTGTITASNIATTTDTITGVLGVAGLLTASAGVTGPTGSFANLNIQTAETTGGTGGSASIGVVGALAGGPTTAAQDGWMKVKIAGTQVWVPVWK